MNAQDAFEALQAAQVGRSEVIGSETREVASSPPLRAPVYHRFLLILHD